MSAPNASAPYRAALVKRRPAPSAAPAAEQAPVARRKAPAAPTAEQRAAEIRAEHAKRIAAEVTAVRRIEAMTRAWNDELASTVPAVASVVSRAVREIVGEAPREAVVATAVRREVSRVRGEHQPVLRVARADGDEWVRRLRARADDGGEGSDKDGPIFAVRPDDALAPGKCVLEIGARRVDLTPEAQLDAFDDALRNGVGTMAPRPSPELPTVPAADPSRHAAPAGTDAERPIVLGEGTTSSSRRVASGTREKPRKVRTRSVRTAALDASSEGAASPNGGASAPDGAAALQQRPGTTTAPTGLPLAVDHTVDAARSRTAPTVPPKSSANGRSMPSPEGIVAPATVNESSAVRPARPADASAAATALDFDSLDLGADAVRYDGTPPEDAPDEAPWIGAVVSAPELGGRELKGSRAVAALRERVARTAGVLRREVDDTDRTSEAADDAVAKVASAGGGKEPDAPEAVLAKRRVPMPRAAPAASTPPGTPEIGPDGFPRFAHASRGDDAPASRPAADGVAAPAEHAPAEPEGDAADLTARLRSARPRPRLRAEGEEASGHAAEPSGEPVEAERRDPIAGDGGESVRRAIAGARRRAARPPALAEGAEGGSREAGDDGTEGAEAPVEPRGDGRATRLPPRIAKLIAAQRGPRS